MRKMLTAVLATAALSAAPVAEVRAQTTQDTLGRVLEGLQGNQQDQRRDDRGGYRDDDRRREEQSRSTTVSCFSSSHSSSSSSSSASSCSFGRGSSGDGGASDRW